jgi:hypothetical protein
VLDYKVFSGAGEMRNAMRVVPNGNGPDVMFTLLSSPQMTVKAFAEDAAAVERDLKTLKKQLER